MGEVVKTKDVNGYRIKVRYDDNGMNPREWDNTTKMVCFHRRYNLGDTDTGYGETDFNSWDELKERIIEDEKPLLIKPLYLYDHSGITISTGPFSCRWDSGQVGFVYITQEDVDKMGVDPLNLDEIMEAEVEEYDKYLRGECYYFQVVRLFKDDDEWFEGKVIEQCGGYNDVEECMKEGESNVP